MILRNFLFLDTNTLTDYLSAIEGYAIEGTIDEKEVKTGGAKAKLGGGQIPAEVNVGGKKIVETSQKKRITETAQFHKFYEYLEREKAIQPITTSDDLLWDQFEKNEFLEVKAKAWVSQSFILSGGIDEISKSIDLKEYLGDKIDSSAKGDFAYSTLMGGFKKAATEAEIPLLYEPVYRSGFLFLSRLKRQYLKCQVADLQTEVTVLGKIQRIVNEGQTIEVFNPLSNLFTSLKRLTEDKLRNLKTEMTKHGLLEEIEGPVIVLHPLAVYS